MCQAVIETFIDRVESKMIESTEIDHKWQRDMRNQNLETFN